MKSDLRFVLFLVLISLWHCKQKINYVDNPTQEITQEPTQYPTVRVIAAEEPKPIPNILPVQVSPTPIKKQQTTFTAKLTLYTTETTTMEGGPKDRKGNFLNSVKSAVANGNPVSVAMESSAFPYGTILRIPEVERILQGHFGKPSTFAFKFKVVDTGGAFKNKGKTRMDICVGSSQSDVRELSMINLQSYGYYEEKGN